jgi:MFS family permease
VTLTALQLGRSTLEVGVLIAVFALLPMLCSVQAGRLIDAIGPYKPMRASAIMVILGALIPFAWQSLPSLMIAAVLIGSGHMTFQIAVQRQMGQSIGEERLRNFSWLSLSMATSGLVGPLIAGISIDHLGHRSVFALLALSPIICFVGVMRMKRYLVSSHIKAPASEVKRSVTDLFASKALRRVFIANMLLSSAWDTHGFVVPIFGVSAGLSATTIGLILAAFASATIVIRIALPVIQRHVLPWQLIHAALIASGVNFLLYPFFSQVWILMSMSFALGLALGSTQPGILALLQHHAPAGRAGEAFGLRMALINGCQVSLPLAFGALGTVMGGVMPLFWITAAALGAGRWFTRDAALVNQGTTQPPPTTPPPT